MIYDEKKRKISETPLGCLRTMMSAPRLQYTKLRLEQAIKICRGVHEPIASASARKIAWALRALVHERRCELEFLKSKEGKRYLADSVKGRVKRKRVRTAERKQNALMATSAA